MEQYRAPRHFRGPLPKSYRKVFDWMEKTPGGATIFKLACLAILFIILAAASQANSDTLKQPPERQFGDWRVTNLGAEPSTLNPITSTDAVASEIQNYIYESLIKRDPKSMEMVPLLADRWEISDDHLVFTFYLKKNIKWEDGQPFTAKDVVFSFNRIMDPKVDAAHLRNYYKDIQQVEALDDFTVRYHYRIPYFLALEFCGGIPIVPAHLFKDGEDFNQHPIARKPMGTGPYKFESWETGKQITLVRNDNYWGDKPALKKLVFKIITNQTVSLQILKQGGLDDMTLRPIHWTRQTGTPRFAKEYKKLDYYSPQYSYIGWNIRKPPFDDKRVRQAMTMLIDREMILKRIFFDLGVVVDSPFYINSPEYNKELKPYPYDPKAALSLLRSAGWTGDGELKKNGKPFEFEFIISAGSKSGEQIATIMQENLKEVGIRMSIRKLEWAVFIQKIENNNFDACTLGWALGWESDPYQLWHSSQSEAKGSNFVGFKNAEADKLMEDARQEFDPKKRIKLYHRLQEIIYDEQPYTFLFTMKALEAVSSRFENVVVYPMGLAPLYWWVPQGAQKYKDP